MDVLGRAFGDAITSIVTMVWRLLVLGASV